MVESGGGIVADPQRLCRIATSVAAAASILEGACRPRRDALAPPPGAWSAGHAAGAATDRWAAFLGRLGDGAGGVASGMRTAAEGYGAADATAARLLDRAR